MRIAPAYAKINLSLEVLGRRSDGYHDLASVLQTVSLHDDLHVSPAQSIAFSCSDPALNNPDNLVVRAAEMLRTEKVIEKGAAIYLTKRTPAAAGLGGGSSDAATTLLSLNRLWDAGTSVPGLSALAAKLGSDVPFFLTGGTALIEGRGERVTPLVDAPVRWFVLAKPLAGLSTAKVFGAVTAADYSDGSETKRLVERIEQEEAVPLGPNGLESAARRICPEAAACLDALADLVPGRTTLSGSGPTSVAWFDAPDDAQTVADAMTDRGYWATRVHSIQRGEIFS
jgi:4-diphosphocytidyl-2-C-methyl-D-erythritol kinase